MDGILPQERWKPVECMQLLHESDTKRGYSRSRIKINVLQNYEKISKKIQIPSTTNARIRTKITIEDTDTRWSIKAPPRGLENHEPSGISQTHGIVIIFSSHIGTAQQRITRKFQALFWLQPTHLHQELMEQNKIYVCEQGI